MRWIVAIALVYFAAAGQTQSEHGGSGEGADLEIIANALTVLEAESKSFALTLLAMRLSGAIR